MKSMFLTGWQRLGIVLSVLWLVSVSIVALQTQTFMRWERLGLMECFAKCYDLKTGERDAACYQDCNMSVDGVSQFQWDWFLATFFLGLVVLWIGTPLVYWVVRWFAVAVLRPITRWVVEGFKGGAR